MSEIKRCPDPNCNYKIGSKENSSAEIALGKHLLHDHPFISGSKRGDPEVLESNFKNRDNIKRWLEKSDTDEIKRWLDGKWEIKTPDKKLEDTDFCVEFDFRNPNECGKEDKEEVDILYWIDFMIILEEFEQHRHLLRHPLFTALIYSQKQMKISCIRRLLKVLFAAFCWLVVFFFAVMFFGQSYREYYQTLEYHQALYGNINWTKCNNSLEIYFIHIDNVFDKTSTTLSIFVSIMFITVILALKQVIHVSMAIRHSRDEMNGGAGIRNLEIWNYFKTIDNWLETIFIGLSIYLISLALYPNKVMSSCEGISLRGVVATMVLIRCIMLLEVFLNVFTMVYSRLVMIRTAFKKIFWNCFYILCFIIPYTASFSMFFYVALHNDYGIKEKKEKNSTNPQNQTDEILKKQEAYVVSDYYNTYIKTFVMFVGELDFSSIPFENAPFFSHLVFIVFLFVIIVLMNLLTGLAVGEVEEIKREAGLSTLMDHAWFIRNMHKTYPPVANNIFNIFNLPRNNSKTTVKITEALKNYMDKKNIMELYLEHDFVRHSIKSYSATITQKLETLNDSFYYKQIINVDNFESSRMFS